MRKLGPKRPGPLVQVPGIIGMTKMTRPGSVDFRFLVLLSHHIYVLKREVSVHFRHLFCQWQGPVNWLHHGYTTIHRPLWPSSTWFDFLVSFFFFLNKWVLQIILFKMLTFLQYFAYLLTFPCWSSLTLLFLYQIPHLPYFLKKSVHVWCFQIIRHEASLEKLLFCLKKYSLI